MAKSVLSDLRFHNEEAAFEYVEKQLWPNGPVCPHCQATGEKIGRLTGKTTRIGLRKCYACRRPFTVRIGTIFEDSQLPLRLWLQSIQLLCSSKKGISTRQLQRTLGCGMKTAWHLGHCICFAMARDGSQGPLGGSGKIVEADETALINSRKTKKPAGQHRRKPHAIVLSLVERGGDTLLDHRGVSRHLRKHIHKDSTLVSDKAPYYVKAPVAKRESVDHSKGEYVRGDVHVNTLEGFFTVIKRGLVGIYQHVDAKHLDRYLAEFDFRQNTRVKLGYDDVQRAEIAIQNAKGKRLPYQTTHSPEA